MSSATSDRRILSHTTVFFKMVPVWFITIVTISFLMQIEIFVTPFMGPGYLFGTVISLLPLLLAVKLTLTLNKDLSLPIGFLVWSFLWGATVATFVAGMFNNLVSYNFTDEAAALLSAPLVEEMMKFIALAIVIGFFSAIDNPLSGLVSGIAVGAGFAVFEDISYVMLATDNSSASSTALLRVFVSPLIHMSTTALAGWVAGNKVLKGENWRLSIVAILLPSIGIHWFWNVSASFFGGFSVLVGLLHTIISIYVCKLAQKNMENIILSGYKIATEKKYLLHKDLIVLQKKLSDKRMLLGGTRSALYQDYARSISMVAVTSTVFNNIPNYLLKELENNRNKISNSF